jgi:hypothetical protein
MTRKNPITTLFTIHEFVVYPVAPMAHILGLI